MHLLGNMIFLWVFGDNIEDRFGHWRYLAFYLTCGLVAFGVQIAFDWNSLAPTIGASGAIAGVLGAYFLLYPYSRVDTLFFIIIIQLPAVVLLGFWFMMQFFNGVGELGSSAQAGGVAYWAHIGGFVFGMLVVVFYKLAKGERLWPEASVVPGAVGGYGEPLEVKLLGEKQLGYLSSQQPQASLPRRRTGVFFHYQEGERLRDFPQALEGILSRDNVFLYDAFYPLKPTSSFDLELMPEEVLLDVHRPEMVEQVKSSGAFDGALISASSTVAAAIRMWRGEIDNAFVFTGYGDHHAGTDFFGGGCYFNGAAIAISQLRKYFGVKRFAIIDTDAHHGDGTWEIFGQDSDVLYMCFCGGGSMEQNNKVDVPVPWRVTDEEYLNLVRENFTSRAQAFQPEVIFWNWGYDGTQGDYGDIGLTANFHTKLAQEIKQTADQICNGRLIVVLCGGSRRDLAHLLIPDIIRVLSS